MALIAHLQKLTCTVILWYSIVLYDFYVDNLDAMILSGYKAFPYILPRSKFDKEATYLNAEEKNMDIWNTFLPSFKQRSNFNY